MSEQTISIQIPPDAQVGDTLTFDIKGTTLEICVPPGAQSGDVLQVQLATDDLAAVAEQTESSVPQAKDRTSVVLWNNCCLELFSSIPSSSGEDDGPSKTTDATDGTHAHVWSAAKNCIDQVLAPDSLCAKLHDNNDELPSRVLELGAGTGVLGLSYCMRLSEKKANTVMLTDSPCALPLLRYNVEHNREKLPSTVTVECQALDWTDKKAVSDEEKYNLILGSDLLYNTSKEILSDLADTIDQHLKVNGRILLSARWRKPESERLFFRLTSDRGIEWSLLYSPQGCELSWNEFGNPKLEPSNRYFMQSSVSVNGELRPLADVDEAAMEKMSDEEHGVFEQSFLQVYLGKKVDGEKTRKRKLAA